MRSWNSWGRSQVVMPISEGRSRLALKFFPDQAPQCNFGVRVPV